MLLTFGHSLLRFLINGCFVRVRRDTKFCHLADLGIITVVRKSFPVPGPYRGYFILGKVIVADSSEPFSQRNHYLPSIILANHTVDGGEILHQLIDGKHPSIYRVEKPSQIGGLWDFATVNHNIQQLFLGIKPPGWWF